MKNCEHECCMTFDIQNNIIEEILKHHSPHQIVNSKMGSVDFWFNNLIYEIRWRPRGVARFDDPINYYENVL